jgi:CHAD domain-containing protein
MVLDYIKLKEIKPALAGYLDNSKLLLLNSPVPDEKAIHDIRVLMKKSRATIKLLAAQLDEETFIREYNSYRETGRLLRSWRESSVIRRTMKGLKKENPDLFNRLNDDKKIQDLVKNNGSDEQTNEEFLKYTEQISTLLNKAIYRLRFQGLDKLDPLLLIKELEKSYEMVSEIYLRCRYNPKPLQLHEFRKKAKDFLYQLYFFRPLNPSGIKNLEKRIDTLTQNLGKFNDLTQILGLLEYKQGNPDNSADLEELVVVIRNKQDKYLLKVWPSSFKIFRPGRKLLNVIGFKFLTI